MGSRNKLSSELQVNYHDEEYFIPGLSIINLPIIYHSRNCSHLSLWFVIIDDAHIIPYGG